MAPRPHSCPLLSSAPFAQVLQYPESKTKKGKKKKGEKEKTITEDLVAKEPKDDVDVMKNQFHFHKQFAEVRRLSWPTC